MEPKDYYYKNFRNDFAEFMAKSKMTYQHPGEGVYIPIQDLNENTMSHVKTDPWHNMRFLYCLAFTVLIDQVMYTYFKSEYKNFQSITLYPKIEYGITNINARPWDIAQRAGGLTTFEKFSEFFAQDFKEFFEKQNFFGANWMKVKETMLNDKDICEGSFGKIFCDKLSKLPIEFPKMMNVKTWAENITKDVYSEYKNKYSFWRHGIKVFYSPVVVDPPLMIISYQPGGTEEDFAQENRAAFEESNFQLPNSNEYLLGVYPMARRVRSFFDFDGGLDLLKSSVVFPLIFFRAPTISIWRQNIPQQTRIKMEEFSFSKVKEMIETLRPQRILVLGIETYDRLKDIFGSVQNEAVLYTRKSNGGRMAVRAEFGKYKLFAVIHPSGARVNRIDWDLIRKLFEKEIRTMDSQS